MGKDYIRKVGAPPSRKPLSAEHQRVLISATLLGEGLNSYRAVDVRSFMGQEGRQHRASAIAQALRYLSGLGYIQQIGPGVFRKFPAPANDAPKTPTHQPRTFEPLTAAELMSGRSAPRRRKQVPLEEPLWQEDATR